MKRLSGEHWALLAILVVALILRVFKLNAGLWYDEIITLTQFIRLPAGELFTTYGSLNNHLLYTWLAKAGVSIFGEMPWIMRLPALVFGVASIWAVWRLIKETGSGHVALVTAALLAVSYHHVWFSQNARGYTGLLLFTTLAALAMHKAMTTRRMVWWFVYAGLFATAMSIHLSAVLLLAAQGLVLLGEGLWRSAVAQQVNFWRWLRGPLIGFVGGGLLVLAVFSPLLPDMMAAFSEVTTSPENKTGGDVSEWRNPLWTLIETVSSFGMAGIAIPLAALFAIIGAARMTVRAPWIALPFLVHIPLTLLVLTLASMRIWPRYFFVDTGFMIACIVYGAYWFADMVETRIPKLWRLGLEANAMKVIGTGLMIAVSLPLLTQNYAHPKQDFIGAYERVEAERLPGEQVATLGLADVAYGQYMAEDWPTISSVEELIARTQGADALWVVTTFPAHTESYFPDANALLETEFDLVERFPATLAGGDVLVYRSKRP